MFASFDHMQTIIQFGLSVEYRGTYHMQGCTSQSCDNLLELRKKMNYGGIRAVVLQGSMDQIETYKRLSIFYPTVKWVFLVSDHGFKGIAPVFGSNFIVASLQCHEQIQGLIRRFLAEKEIKLRAHLRQICKSGWSFIGPSQYSSQDYEFTRFNAKVLNVSQHGLCLLIEGQENFREEKFISVKMKLKNGLVLDYQVNLRWRSQIDSCKFKLGCQIMAKDILRKVA